MFLHRSGSSVWGICTLIRWPVTVARRRHDDDDDDEEEEEEEEGEEDGKDDTDQYGVG